MDGLSTVKPRRQRSESSARTQGLIKAARLGEQLACGGSSDRREAIHNLLNMLPSYVCSVSSAKWCGGIGGPCRDRTYDQEIKSLLLYQLS
jgi:hypothetical protein